MTAATTSKTAETLTAAAGRFLANPGRGRFLDPDTGAICMIGAVCEARGGCALMIDEITADAWPEVRALAQALSQLGLGVAGAMPLQYSSAVVLASDFYVERGEHELLRRVFRRAIEIEEAAACAV